MCCEGEGCIEIKCPYTVAEAAKITKDFCSSEVNGQLHLKPDHRYYHQIQAQMFITNRDYCDFVIWTPKDMAVERRYLSKSGILGQNSGKSNSIFSCWLILPELVAKHYTSASVSFLPRPKIGRSD